VSARLLAALLALALSAPAEAQFREAPSLREAMLATDAAPPPPQQNDRWIALDKAQHFTFSALFVLAGQYVLTDKAGLSEGEALPIACGGALALGLAKEVADANRPRHPLFSWKDLVADAAGVAVGAAIVAL
jgi:uncharacterized protein YfiM (DUF2279 family)